MARVEFGIADKVRLRPGSDMWTRLGKYRGEIGRIEAIVFVADQDLVRATVRFRNGTRVQAIPADDLEYADPGGMAVDRITAFG